MAPISTFFYHVLTFDDANTSRTVEPVRDLDGWMDALRILGSFFPLGSVKVGLYVDFIAFYRLRDDITSSDGINGTRPI